MKIMKKNFINIFYQLVMYCLLLLLIWFFFLSRTFACQKDLFNAFWEMQLKQIENTFERNKAYIDCLCESPLLKNKNVVEAYKKNMKENAYELAIIKEKCGKKAFKY